MSDLYFKPVTHDLCKIRAVSSLVTDKEGFGRNMINFMETSYKLRQLDKFENNP